MSTYGTLDITKDFFKVCPAGILMLNKDKFLDEKKSCETKKIEVPNYHGSNATFRIQALELK